MNKLVLITDAHLQESTLERNIGLFLEVDKIAQKEQSPIIILGDCFAQRKSQTLKTLTTFKSLLLSLKSEVFIIPGNHDKVDYKSEDSYLDVYAPYGNNIHIIRVNETIIFGDVACHFVPYFKEGETYKSYLSKLRVKKGKKNILFTHIAFNGAVNNDGSVVEDGVSPKDVQRFDHIYVGHYHNASTFKNISYIGSAFPNSHAESNEDKGIKILDLDTLSIKNIQWGFPTFKSIKFDLNEYKFSDIMDAAEECQSSIKEGNRIRFIFVGDKAQLKEINISLIKRKGIDVKKLGGDKEFNIKEFKEGVVYYSPTLLKTEFLDFCQLNKKSPDIGLKYLEQQLNL